MYYLVEQSKGAPQGFSYANNVLTYKYHDTNSAIKLWPLRNVNLYVHFCAKGKTLGTETFKGLTYRLFVGNKTRVLNIYDIQLRCQVCLSFISY